MYISCSLCTWEIKWHLVCALPINFILFILGPVWILGNSSVYCLDRFNRVGVHRDAG